MTSKGDLGYLCHFIPQSFSECLLHMYPGAGTQCAMVNGVASLPELGGGGRGDNTETHYTLGSLWSCPERKPAYLLIKRQHFLQFSLVSEISLLRGFKPE